MKVIAHWSDADVAKVRELVRRFGDSEYQRRVRAYNLAHPWVQPSDDAVWDTHIHCMLTSLQRAGLDGKVNRVFGDLAWGESGVSVGPLRAAADPVRHAQEFLRASGFRMWQRRGRWIGANFARFVEGDRCMILERTSAELVTARKGAPPPPAEMLAVERRAVSALCAGNWKAAGIGPKQARHFLKETGLAAWTIPLDSRLMRFLWEVSESSDHCLPWTPALADEYTFRMVEN